MSKQYKDRDGSLMCARYAYKPNKLRYCGGNKNSQLFDYTVNLYQDPGLQGILEEFETLHPYLKLIAGSNKIKNPFDRNVVEAYWIGNNLLTNISTSKLFQHIVDIQKLKKKLNPEIFKQVVGVLPKGALPHHSFHVINIPKRTGHYPVEHTLETMDKCRISWGIVEKILKNKLQISSEHLVLKDNIIGYGDKKINNYIWQIGERGFIKNIKKGDWVSLHWDFVCDKLNQSQVQNLKYYTQLSINLANSQING